MAILYKSAIAAVIPPNKTTLKLSVIKASINFLGTLFQVSPLGTRGKGAVTPWGMLFLGMIEEQEEKPSCASTFQVSAYVTSNNIPMAKTSNMAKPTSKHRKLHQDHHKAMVRVLDVL